MRTGRHRTLREVRHGLHGMHGLRAVWVASLGLVLASSPGAAEPMTIPTASVTKDAPRCTIGQPCIFAAPIFACDYAGAEKIAQAGPALGSGIGMELVKGQSCQVVSAGRLFATEATKSAQVVYLTEAGQHLGYMPIGVFAMAAVDEPVEPDHEVSVRITTRVGEITLNLGLGPLARVVGLAGQGSGKAAGVFRVGPAERRAFCADFAGSGGPRAMRDCFEEFTEREVRAQAGCENRVVTVLDRTYRLHRRPADFPLDGHNDAARRWLWQDVASDEWLDGSSPSGEITVDSAFDALCPGRRPDAERGLVLRNPAARFPLIIQGTWMPNMEACARMRREGGGPVGDALTIRAREVQGDDYRETLNQLRRLGAQSWIADVSWSGEDDSGLASISYQLIGETLLVVNGRSTQRLGRCR